MIRQDHPFQPGARVAIESHGAYHEGRVEKVDKTGHFTLVDGNGQRYRPHWPGYWDNGKWIARETGNFCSRKLLMIWDETTDAEIAEKIARTKRRERWNSVHERLRNMRPDDVTDFMLDAIEAALAVRGAE